MIKRILLSLALAASLGGAVIACNTPATTAPSLTPTTAPTTAPAASDALPSVDVVPSSEPSAS